MQEINSKPDWLKIQTKYGLNFSKIKSILKKNNLNTVCEEANCPNISECWHNYGTATFMVLGNICTRGCQFCSVKKAKFGEILDELEPIKIAKAVNEIGLKYVVITSVDRDDLEDQGANHFAKCIKEIKKINKDIFVEVLIPDFTGRIDLLKIIVDSNPDVIGHNLETVEELQNKIRDIRAGYKQSLSVLANVKKLNKNIYTKSSIMLGLGETEEQIIKTMKDLRNINCDFFTMGQYLKPSSKVLEVKEYVKPEKFNEFKKIALDLGFLFVASGPFVRSSYKAHEYFMK
jgi:lipoyl synthase